MSKKLTLIGIVLVALLIAAMPFMVACEEEETVTPTPTTTPTTPTTPTVPPEPIELIFNDHNPAPTGPAMSYDYWADKVWEDSFGQLKITVIHGGALFTGDEVYQAVKSGACAGGHYVVDEEDGFLLNLIMTMPFMGWPGQHVEDAYQTLLDEFPEMAAEWEGVTIMHYMMMPPTHLHFSGENVVVRTPADLAGMKIFCAEATLANIVNAAGGVAVEHGIMDMTPDVQTGVVQGVLNHFPVLNVFGTLELCKSHTVFGDGGINITPMFTIMNTDVLNGLPADLQDLLMDSGHYWFDKFYELDAGDIAKAQSDVTAWGHTMTVLTPAEIAVWRDAVKAQISDAWIAKCAAAGLPGQAVYDRALELTQTVELR